MDDVLDFIIPEIPITCLLGARHHVGSEGTGRWAWWEVGHGMWLTGLCGGWWRVNEKLKMACAPPKRTPV